MLLMLGTAGHVDHGKTALIRCLTGTHTAHLPEEKKRGMTIDLGFAALDDPKHGRIGIIDVPGHERFIRNMVTGTWGLDAALLLVAADDGWMRMSTDHLRVLKAMGVSAILAVITKIDLVAPERIAELKDAIAEKSRRIVGAALPVCAVSAQSGEGIDTLRKEITSLLSTVSPRTEPHEPMLYIDRSFVLKGIGRTITGTLRGSAVRLNDELFLYPAKKSCRVKSIQNHSAEVREARPASRTALHLKISDKTALDRGMLLAGSKADILCGTHLIIRIDELFIEDETLKNHIETEIALGSTHAVGKLHFSRFEKSLARMSVSKPISAYYNQPAVLIRHGGSTILAACRILNVFTTYHRTEIKELFQIYTKHSPTSRNGVQFYARGFIPLSQKDGSGICGSEAADVGEYVIHTEFLKKWTQQILNAVKKSRTGITVDEFTAALPQNAKMAVFTLLTKKKQLIQKDGRFFDAHYAGIKMNETAKKLIAEAKREGTKGILLQKNAEAAPIRKEARALAANKQLIQLDEYLYYGIEAYNEVCKKLFDGKKTGTELSIADARESTGLSRKYIIPLFNIFERRGFLKRRGDIRIIIALP